MICHKWRQFICWMCLVVYSNFWFILSIWLSVCGWNDVDSFVWMSNILFKTMVSYLIPHSLAIHVTFICYLWTILLTLLLIFPLLFLQNVSILDNLSQTTRITSFPATNGNLEMKSTIKCIYGFSSILPSLPVPLFYSSSSNTYYICLYIFLHLYLSLATNIFSSPALLSFIFLHV